MKQSSNRKTRGDFYIDGMIELVADRMHDGQLSLLLWKEEKAVIGRCIKIDRKTKCGSETDLQTITFEPEELSPTYLRAMRFPSHAKAFGTTRQLLDEICGVVKRYTYLADDYVLLAAHSVLASWFSDATDLPVALVICGPRCHQGQRLFRVLSCLYRRALLVGEISLASLCSLPMGLLPSLFFERYDNSPQIQRVIRATRTRGNIPSKGKLVSTRCTTVIYSEEPLNGGIPDDSSIDIPVSHSGCPLPLLNEDVQQGIAETFQPKLLMYRLMNYAKVMNSTFDAAPLNSCVNDLARVLGACVVDDPDRQSDIVRLLRKKDKEVMEDCSWDLSVTVLEAMLSLCHKKKKSVYVSEIANEANAILERRGEFFMMTARAVGGKLLRLGLITGRMGAAGRGMLLTREIQIRIHRLARDNRLKLEYGGEIQCDYCDQLTMKQPDGEENPEQELADSLPGIIASYPDRNNSLE
jgi:hypothetical protein